MARPTGGGGSNFSSGGHRGGLNSGGHQIGGGRPTNNNSFNRGSNNRNNSFDALDAIRLASTIGSITREVSRNFEHRRQLERSRQREDERQREHEREMERRRAREEDRDASPRASSNHSYNRVSGMNYGEPEPLRRERPVKTKESPVEKKPTSISVLNIVASFCMIMVLLIFILVGIAFIRNPESSQAHEKLEDTTYSADCIIDNDGWFSNTTKLSKKLKSIYFDKTGIQPYLVINEYIPYLNTDADKQEYAEKWYNDHITNQHTFLFMYFPNQDPGQIGYMCYVNGMQVSDIMDSAVIEKFWNLMDKNWNTAPNSEELIIKVYGETANFAMKGVASAYDVAKGYILDLLFLILVFVACQIAKVKIVRAKEKAEETERILNSDIDTIANEMDDDLLNGAGGL